MSLLYIWTSPSWAGISDSTVTHHLGMWCNFIFIFLLVGVEFKGEIEQIKKIKRLGQVTIKNPFYFLFFYFKYGEPNKEGMIINTYSHCDHCPSLAGTTVKLILLIPLKLHIHPSIISQSTIITITEI